MREFSDRSQDPSVSGRRSRRPSLRLSHLLLPAAILATAALAGLVIIDPYAQTPMTVATAPEPQASVTPDPYAKLLDPGYSLGIAPRPLDRGQKQPVAGLIPASPQPPARPATIARVEPDAPAQSQIALPPLPGESARIVEMMRLPVPRPSDLRLPPAPERPRLANPQPQRRMRAAAAPPPAEDNRSFFEKLFGTQRPAERGPALAYAAPQDDIVDAARGRRLSPLVAPPVSTAQATAVYDISARTVHMPNGEKLEAHSGLGEHMDDPRYVHLRMRGATPPHTYNLTMREAPFHGVRALRMNPVGGSAAIHGRTGLLTHSYLLGPNGDSNGCVSFKDYDRFLQAYLRGEVKRLVVVAKLG